jgi:predicted DNA binding CopG/RHH family protein
MNEERNDFPEFETEEEFIAWFDTHDMSPYMDTLEEVTEKFTVIRTRSTTRPVDLRLRTDHLEAIKALAERRGMAYQTLIQHWLLEKLHQEAPDSVAH